MTSRIKGLKIELTVNCSVKADEIAYHDEMYRLREEEHRTDSGNSFEARNLDVQAGAGFSIGADEDDTEIDLRELVDLIKESFSTTTKEVVEKVEESVKDSATEETSPSEDDH